MYRLLFAESVTLHKKTAGSYIVPQFIVFQDSEMEEKKYNDMQTVKRRFFAMRNGVIADTLRSAGLPYKVIFGLNLPQIVEIASESPHTAELAEALWANNTTRESMLMAPMLADPTTFSIEDARRWLDTVPTAEVADILCHRLLRRTPYAWDLAESLIDSPIAPFDTYVALRLAFNLVSTAPERALAVAGKGGNHPVALALADEARFLITGELN